MSDIELVQQQNSEIPVIVDKEEFTIELQNYYRAHKQNSKKLEWTNQRIQSVINLLEEYHTIKTQGGRVANKHYHHAKKYDIMNIGDQKVLIVKRKDISDPVVQIIPTEEYYQKILDAHIATGHGRRDKIIHALKDKYVVPIFAVLIFINLCTTCLSKKNCPKKGKVVKPVISDDFNSRGQMDLAEFMCENERNIKREGTQSRINLKRVADKTISTSSKKFKDISTGSTVSFEVLNVDVGPLNSKNLIGKVLLKKNELYQGGTTFGKDRMPQNAVLSTPNEELLSDNLELEQDMENYMRYKIMGSVKKIRLQPHCIPSRFSWNRKHKSLPNESHLVEAKTKRLKTSKSKDSVQNHLEEDNVKASSTACIEDSQSALDDPAQVIQEQEEVLCQKHKSIQASQKTKYTRKQIDVKHKDEMTSPLNTYINMDHDYSQFQIHHEVMIKPDPDEPEQEEENKLGNEDIDRSSSSMFEENIDIKDIVPILRDMTSCLQTIANKYDDSFDSFSKFMATTLRNMPQQDSEELQRQILNLVVAHLNKNKLTNGAEEKS